MQISMLHSANSSHVERCWWLSQIYRRVPCAQIGMDVRPLARKGQGKDQKRSTEKQKGRNCTCESAQPMPSRRDTVS